MKNVLLFLCLLGFASGFAKEHALPVQGMRRIQAVRSMLAKAPITTSALRQSPQWIIGQDDPNQIVEVNAPMRYDGDIIIVNDGQLIVRRTDFTLNGDLQIAGNGRAQFVDASLTIVQDYSYEHEAIVAQNGLLDLEHVAFQASGQSWSVGLVGEASYRLSHSTITDGFITTAAFESASIHVDHTKTAGEFLCFGDNPASFSTSDVVLFWLVLPDSSIVDSTLPEDSLLVDWSFPDESAHGIPYSAKIDSCTSVQWGLISRTGSTATFRNTHFRVIGLYFESPDSLAVDGMVNGSTHVDDIVPAADRTLHLINSSVDTWNFYTALSAKLSLDNCIFGEALAMDSSKVTILNSVCDGSGGYIGAMNKSFLIVFGSLIKSQVTSRQNAVLVGANSSFTGGELDADEESIMFLANTTYAAPPQAHNGASIFEAQLGPVDGVVDSEIPLVGTARLLRGPESPLEFRGYRVDYRPQNGVWRPVHDKRTTPVFNDLLATWRTFNLQPGPYDLRLSLFHNFGDSISLDSYGRLSLNTFVSENNAHPAATRLLQNSPNPFNPATMITYELSQSGPVHILIYNSLGQVVDRIDKQTENAGSHQVRIDASAWPAGAYYYKLQTPAFVDVRSMTLVK